MTTKNYIHLDSQFGWFLGRFDNNAPHQHYAVQLSIPLEGNVRITTDEEEFFSPNPILIPSNRPHQLESDGSHLLILFNPISPMGHYWSSKAADAIQTEAHGLSMTWTSSLQNALMAAKKEDYASIIREYLAPFDCLCHTDFHLEDDRIGKAIEYLHLHCEAIVPVEKMAEIIHLSPSRFLHLFKETTGITYRRAQLWNKIMQALPLLADHSLTEIAHQTGFADSAHFSRTTVENFGFSPKMLTKNSQFIQV